MVGFAVQDGLINSMNDPISNYLPHLSNDERYARVKIKHLLNHTSGIEHPLTVDALLYYGKNLRRANNYIKFKNEPGTNQAYMNMNVWILDNCWKK